MTRLAPCELDPEELLRVVCLSAEVITQLCRALGLPPSEVREIQEFFEDPPYIWDTFDA